MGKLSGARIKIAQTTLHSRKRCDVPRYYFHIRRGRATVLDHDGVDLADIREAAVEAARRGREIASAEAPKGKPLGGVVIVVADDQWSPVFEVVINEPRGG